MGCSFHLRCCDGQPVRLFIFSLPLMFRISWVDSLVWLLFKLDKSQSNVNPKNAIQTSFWTISHSSTRTWSHRRFGLQTSTCKVYCIQSWSHKFSSNNKTVETRPCLSWAIQTEDEADPPTDKVDCHRTEYQPHLERLGPKQENRR
jgi:hypothetical protein